MTDHRVDSGLPPAMTPSEPIAVAMLTLPKSWTVVRQDTSGRAAEQRGLAVIETVHRESDGKRWHHVSMSRASRMPTYEDVSLVRRVFIGEAVECYQVFPPASRYVNRHPFCLHLWHCLDVREGAVLPDFRKYGEV